MVEKDELVDRNATSGTINFCLSPKFLKNCPSLVDSVQGSSKISTLLTFMLKIINLSKNSLMLVNMVKKDELMGGNTIDRTINFCLSPKSLIISKIIKG